LSQQKSIERQGLGVWLDSCSAPQSKAPLGLKPETVSLLFFAFKNHCDFFEDLVLAFIKVAPRLLIIFVVFVFKCFSDETLSQTPRKGKPFLARTHIGSGGDTHCWANWLLIEL